jgi:hypothetical protein
MPPHQNVNISRKQLNCLLYLPNFRFSRNVDSSAVHKARSVLSLHNAASNHGPPRRRGYESANLHHHPLSGVICMVSRDSRSSAYRNGQDHQFERDRKGNLAATEIHSHDGPMACLLRVDRALPNRASGWLSH